MDQRNEILKLHARKEKEFERNKLKRFALAVLLYTGVFFVVEYIKTGSLYDFGDTLIGCLFGAIGMVIFSSFVFNWLFKSSESEERYLQELKNELAFIEHNKK